MGGGYENFLGFLVNLLTEKKIVVNSEVFWSEVFRHESKFYHRQYLELPINDGITDESKYVTFNKSLELFTYVKGLFVYFSLPEFRRTLNFLCSSFSKEFPKGYSEMKDKYLLDFIDMSKLQSLFAEDLANFSSDLLLIPLNGSDDTHTEITSVDSFKDYVNILAKELMNKFLSCSIDDEVELVIFFNVNLRTYFEYELFLMLLDVLRKRGIYLNSEKLIIRLIDTEFFSDYVSKFGLIGLKEVWDSKDIRNLSYDEIIVIIRKDLKKFRGDTGEKDLLIFEEAKIDERNKYL